jgi:hypothetical protein
MGKIIGALAIASITFSYANAGMAQVAETVPATAYPDPQCTKPDLGLIKPPQLGDATDDTYNTRVRAYNFHIKEFNQASEAYRACIHAYVDNANREVKRIQDQANVDLKRITENSNTAMDGVQGKVKQAISDLNDLVRAEESAMAAPPGHR